MLRRVLCGILAFMLLGMILLITVGKILAGEHVLSVLLEACWEGASSFFISWLLLFYAFKGRLPIYFSRDIFTNK